MTKQIMTRKELVERGLFTDGMGKVLNEYGNEYRGEDGQCMFVEQEECRWCGVLYDPKDSEHRHLCSNKCFHEEQAVQ